ncbi:hypothetical protein [Peptostreptococcus faecalis]|uniref:hypothetical protein n=1 Tax=Peptostreptococcus faecalis TaxID=2045015 RepID=UPI000C79DF30|nr:hypothetical protein [Peptostreptococcus faecalis]
MKKKYITKIIIIILLSFSVVRVIHVNLNKPTYSKDSIVGKYTEVRNGKYYYELISSKEINDKDKIKKISESLDKIRDAALDDKKIIEIKFRTNDINLDKELQLFSGNYSTKASLGATEYDNEKKIMTIIFAYNTNWYNRNEKFYISTPTPYYKKDIFDDIENHINKLYDDSTKKRLIFEFNI